MPRGRRSSPKNPQKGDYGKLLEGEAGKVVGEGSPFSSLEVALSLSSPTVSPVSEGIVDFSEDILSGKVEDAFLKWLRGEEGLPPPEIEKLQMNFNAKLQIVMSYFILETMLRMQELSKFLKKAGKTLFDSDDVEKLDLEDLKQRYGEGQRVFLNTVEFVRKFLYQNQEALDPNFLGLDTIKTLLMSLPPEKLRLLKEKLQKGEV